MKTVFFKGNQYTVPEWAKFIALDSDGEVYVYSVAPRLNEDTQNYGPTSSSECLRVGNINCVGI